MTGKHLFALASGCAAATLLCAAFPAQAGTQQGTARSRIRGALTITNTAPLDFGNIIRGTTAGTVTINAQTGVRTSTGGITPVGGAFGRAIFNASGTPNTVTTFNLTPATITIRRVSGTETMTINQVRLSANGGAPQTVNRNRTLPASGVLPFAMAGRLNIAANQVPGTYAGTFTITVNYQ